MFCTAFGRGSPTGILEHARILEPSLSKMLSILKRLIEEALILMTASAELHVMPRDFLWSVLTQGSCSRVMGEEKVACAFWELRQTKHQCSHAALASFQASLVGKKY